MRMSRLCVATAALLLVAVVSAQWDPATGYIKPTPGVPRFDPVPWNTAYTVKNSANASALGTFLRDCLPEDYNTRSGWSTPLGGCFYKNTTGGMVDYWVKYRGLAFEYPSSYCYALNHFDGRGACYPGSSKKGSKVVIIGCPALHQALVDDGAVRVTRQKALSRQSEKGHYIAAMARPDFKDCVSGYCSKTDILSEKHFLRKDISGSWSFKFPGMPATDRDLEGQLITDPEAAPLPGLYVVCGYYQVDPRMPTGGGAISPGPLAVKGGTVPGTISPSHYNPGIDAVLSEEDKRNLAADAAWARKRGTKEYEQWRAKLEEAVQVGRV